MVLRLCLVLGLAWLAQEAAGAPLAPATASLGAAHASSVALLEPLAQEGAQRSFDLFYPQLPAAGIGVKEEETSTVSVPVIHLPAWEDEQEDGLEKVAAGALLDMFPQDLLEHSNKVRPVNVKIIEHDGYIDYEIEFVELEDYYDYLDEDYNGFGQKLEEETTTTVSPPQPSPEITFVDLLKKARSQHRQRQQQADNQNILEEINRVPSTDTPTTLAPPGPESTGDGDTLPPAPATELPAAVTKQQVKPTPAPASSRHRSRGRSTTSAKPEPRTPAAATTWPAGEEETRTTAEMQPTTTTTTTTTEVTTAPITPPPVPEYPELPRSSIFGGEQEEEYYQDYQVDREQGDVEGDAFGEFADDFIPAESQPHLAVFTGPQQTEDTASSDHRVPKLISSKPAKGQVLAQLPGIQAGKHVSTDYNEDKDYDAEYNEDEAVSATTGAGGLYHEVNPGQYHEVNPGQYHEVNPGQYHEINPGQYHEVNPGQYHEVNPGQYRLDDKDIRVSVDNNREDDSRTYDVRANAGDFIIGEVGRIDGDGQTLEGVRYTALESEVDYDKIKEILEMYFGARTA